MIDCWRQGPAILARSGERGGGGGRCGACRHCRWWSLCAATSAAYGMSPSRRWTRCPAPPSRTASLPPAARLGRRVPPAAPTCRFPVTQPHCTGLVPAHAARAGGEEQGGAGLQAVATASGDGTVRVWSLAGGACLRTLEGHTASALRCAFLTAGTQVCSPTAARAGPSLLGIEACARHPHLGPEWRPLQWQRLCECCRARVR